MEATLQRIFRADMEAIRKKARREHGSTPGGTSDHAVKARCLAKEPGLPERCYEETQPLLSPSQLPAMPKQSVTITGKEQCPHTALRSLPNTSFSPAA